MTLLEALATLLAGGALGAAAGLLLAARRERRSLRHLVAYLDGWFDAKLDEADARAEAATRGRPGWGPVYGKLAERRQAFWEVRALSDVTACRLQRLIDVITDEALVYDGGARLLFASAQIRALCVPVTDGPDPDPADSSPELHVVAAFLAAHDELRDLVAAALAGAAPPPSNVVLRSRGVERSFIATAHRVPGPGGDEGLLVLLTPREAFEELRRSGERAVALDHVTLVSELVAHRLRNPLNSIVLLIEVLRREVGRNEGGLPVAHLEGVEAEVARLEATIERFLQAVARRGRRVEAVELAGTIETAAELLYPVAREAGVQVRQELHAAASTVRADARELIRALLAPALAALRETSVGGSLKFRLDSDRREHVVLLEVPTPAAAEFAIAVAEDLVARNGGRLDHEIGPPARVTYRFPAEGSPDRGL